MRLSLLLLQEILENPTNKKCYTVRREMHSHSPKHLWQNKHTQSHSHMLEVTHLPPQGRLCFWMATIRPAPQLQIFELWSPCEYMDVSIFKKIEILSWFKGQKSFKSVRIHSVPHSSPTASLYLRLPLDELLDRCWQLNLKPPYYKDSSQH